MTAKTGATYSQAKECFDNVDSCHEKLRGVKVGDLSYKEIEKVIIEIQGKDGSSPMLSKMTDEPKKYGPFFCFLKTLIKLCNWAMTAQKVEQHTKKVDVLNKRINDSEACNARNRAIVKTLAEMDQLVELKDFFEQTELRIIKDKKERVNQALNLVREKRNNFIANFFKEEWLIDYVCSI